ncbi:MAG TPA: penicillin-binding transpeptidase domain-containing protein [Solirubrobacteraceae bacterium]
MIEAPLQRRAPLPPQLTRRVGVLGVVALALFGIISFRLWYLQVLTGPQNAARATANVVQPIPIPAPRGNILDAGGAVLATYRNAIQVSIVKDELPPEGAQRENLYKRLAHVLGLSWQQVRTKVQTGVVAPGYAPTPIGYVGTKKLAYLAERKRFYPGVVEASVPVRDYPQGDIGAVLLGQVGAITGPSKDSPGELGSARYKGVSANSIVGQSGLEAEYQPYLQGIPGEDKVEINAAGYPTGAQRTPIAPTPGDQLVTSIHLGLEREGYIAARQAMSAAQGLHNPATAAAFVAMDPFTGRVYAAGSLPTYNANDFATGVGTSAYNKILNSSALNDRAINGAYPTGSTFKPITALAALGAGVITPATLQGGGTTYTVGKGAAAESFKNSGGADYGDLDLVNALAVSEDTYFYPLGATLNGDGKDLALQDEARALGLGSSPQIDLPGGGFAGIVPDYRYVAEVNKTDWAQFCQGPQGTLGARPKPAYRSDTLAITGCGQGVFEYWTEGQNIQLATGQGFLEATPLQMALAYSAIVNGGKVWAPQIATQILSASGQVIQQLPPPRVRNTVPINPAYRAAVMSGLHAAAQGTTGTSDAIFGSFPRPVYGKTGTAQHAGQADQSWYVAYAPDAKRPIVIAVTIEKGGFGAAAAAPAVRLMLSQWFGIKKTFIAGTNPDL